MIQLFAPETAVIHVASSGIMSRFAMSRIQACR
jgi:hypothetical protein